MNFVPLYKFLAYAIIFYEDAVFEKTMKEEEK